MVGAILGWESRGWVCFGVRCYCDFLGREGSWRKATISRTETKSRCAVGLWGVYLLPGSEVQGPLGGAGV